MKTKIFLLVTVIFSYSFSIAQDDIKVYPTHWFTKMKWNKLQLLIHSEGIAIGLNKVSIQYPGVTLKSFKTFESKNYLVVNVEIAATALPGKFDIRTNKRKISYELKAPAAGNGSSYAKGVNQTDFVYLIMPDRFSNGDPSNDVVGTYKDKDSDRKNPFDRHGGDLKGVENKLDYLKDLGVTAIWMTPVVENDMARTLEGGTSRSTYHGYAFTNQYEIDQRFGGHSAYKSLIGKMHSKGMKIIQDAVYNHIGIDHFLYKDMPAKDWINQWPSYQNTSYKDQPLPDPYASNDDRNIAVNGWFTPFLIDLNQRNEYVKNFLIQYNLWATQEYQLDGWRIDTYFYSDAQFLNEINTAMLADFPALSVFGEAWVNSVPNSAYFCQNNMQVPFKHNAQGVTDFPFLFASLAAFNEKFGWNDGVSKLYQTIAQDYLYKNAFNNCIFLTNHDLDRTYSVLGENLQKMKSAHALLLTQRGIPQIYYGDEILVKNFKNPSDAEVRKDFEGGWPGDAVNKFDPKARTAQENEFFNYLKTLANYRKNSEALQFGKLMQYLPQDGVYVYFRYTKSKNVMVVINTNEKERKISLSRFKERMGTVQNMKDIFTLQQVSSTEVSLKGYESGVYEF